VEFFKKISSYRMAVLLVLVFMFLVLALNGKSTKNLVCVGKWRQGTTEEISFRIEKYRDWAFFSGRNQGIVRFKFQDGSELNVKDIKFQDGLDNVTFGESGNKGGYSGEIKNIILKTKASWAESNIYEGNCQEI
jgi:hypothetical protein